MIFAGGTLIFIATLLLFIQLWNLRGEVSASLKFYATGLFYLLVGIIIGTGLWLNWSNALYIKIPLEAHIHANSWGFMSLTFAGLLVDFIPMITGQALGSPKSITAIFWGMALGAFFLVLGPWLGGNMPAAVAGLILHISSTVWLVVLMGRALKASGRLSTAGGWPLLASYLWILLPVFVAPLIILGFIPGGSVEATAPQPLIYGWVMLFGIATKFFTPVMAIVVFAIPTFLQYYPVFLKPKPAVKPEGQPGWPLYFVGIAFYNNRKFGALLHVRSTH